MKFSPITGTSITLAEGQTRYGFACDDHSIDIYDLTTDKYWQTNPFPGNSLVFFDFKTQKKFEPIPSKENIFFFSPIFQNDYFYFLKADLDEYNLSLYKYLPGHEIESIYQMSLKNINTCNLSLVYDEATVWIASFDDEIDFYYPKEFSVDNKPDQTLLFISNEQLYFEQDSDYYSDNEFEHIPDRIIVKDFQGRIKNNFIGNIIHLSNGKWQKVDNNFLLPYWRSDNQPLNGQDRYWVTISDYTQFEDLKDTYWKKRVYPGNFLIFYDQIENKTFYPISQQKNICYGQTIFNDGFFYFTQVNTEENKLKIFKYYPEKILEPIYSCSLNEINLKNVIFIQNDHSVELISILENVNDDCSVLKGYFPDKFSCTFTEKQYPLFMKSHKLYLSDYDEKYNSNGDFVKYIDYTCVKDLKDKILSREIGSYILAPDGNWWLS